MWGAVWLGYFCLDLGYWHTFSFAPDTFLYFCHGYKMVLLALFWGLPPLTSLKKRKEEEDSVSILAFRLNDFYKVRCGAQRGWAEEGEAREYTEESQRRLQASRHGRSH